MNGKRRRGDSVLTRQKPKKARSRLLQALKRRRVLLSGVVFASALVVGLFLFKRRALAPIPAVGWKVVLKIDSDTPLGDKVADALTQAVARNLGSGSKSDLRRAARMAQQSDSFASVHVLKTGPREVVVHVRPRVAELCIEADRIRLLASDGIVYGSVDNLETCPGPVLKGVFSENRPRFSWLEDQTLALDAEEQSLVREALDLVRLLNAKGLPVATIENRRYRGFGVRIKGRELDVAIGRAPFAAKLAKLGTILDRQAERGEQASRIELDYQGKAFVKLKKM